MYCQLSDINKQSTHHTLCDKQAELKCPSCNSGVCLDHWDKMAGICKACAGVIDQMK